MVEIFEEWDADGSGKIDAREFRLACAHLGIDASHEALNGAFNNLSDLLTRQISRAGFPAEAAADLAALVLTSYEGGLMMARAAGSTDPIERSFRALLSHVRLQQKEFANGH